MQKPPSISWVPDQRGVRARRDGDVAGVCQKRQGGTTTCPTKDCVALARVSQDTWRAQGTGQ